MPSLFIYSNLSIPPPISLHGTPTSSLNPDLDLQPPPYSSSEKTMIMTMRIWKENRRKICQNPIRRSASTSIWSLIPIQFRRLPPSPPFLISNIADGGRQDPRPGPSSDRRHHHRGLPVPPLCPLRHLFLVVIFIIALPQIGVRQRVGGGTFPLPLLLLLFF